MAIPYMVYMQALDTGNSYHISKNRENLFLGKKGLFIFNADPGNLILRMVARSGEQQYIGEMKLVY